MALLYGKTSASGRKNFPFNTAKYIINADDRSILCWKYSACRFFAGVAFLGMDGDGVGQKQGTK